MPPVLAPLFPLLLALAVPSRARTDDLARFDPPSWAPVFAELKGHLQALVRLDTSNPPGDEILAARYLRETLGREGIAGEVFVSTGTRASLVARLKAQGPARGRPFLLMCHTDVVPAERARWSVDPFAGTEKDGFIWGRGTADIKGMCAAELMVVELLKRARVPLSRDVIFFAQADEESGTPDSGVGGSDRHLAWFLREHGDAVDAEYGLNEGGHTLWRSGAIAAIHLQVAEKRYLDVKLVARGTPGHSSLPRADNPVHALARALARLSAWRPPVEIHPVVLRFLQDGAAQGTQERRELIAALSGPGWEEAARRLEELDPETGALLHDTAAATIVRGGYKANVVPSRAEAVVNCRLMPGRDPERFVEELRRVVAEPGVEVSYEPDPLPPVAAMPLDTPLHQAVEAAAAEAAPGAPVSPLLSAWSTDSQSLRARGTIMYGLDPPLSAEDAGRAHGDDERISIDALNAYLRLLYRVTLRMTARERT